ncbi:MAG: pyridoxamine 5'-phosphate oxidase [Bdellovibrio sp.]|nr:MAG: pyridoxamine 5'-phosphate oxidase [Bdellovibrio sp.]
MFEFVDDPLKAFAVQFENAAKAGILDPSAMSLATASADGIPSVRIVLLKETPTDLLRDTKGPGAAGFSFFTNYESEKSKELAQNPPAALLFFWPQLEQQIRVSGTVERLSRQENENYFSTRPRLSQIGAWASLQSQEIPNSAWLEKRVEEYTEKFAGKDVPCPERWGGFRLLPLAVEFWFGKLGRLHERYCYERASLSGPWRKFMRSP